jgi:2-polyprenyl-6-methoxyphenol hydroxylase-like FAD-dependent oxidoreductase
LSGTAVVVGAGIGGLAAAAALRHAGLDVAVYEQSPSLQPIGAGLTLWPNATRALRALGLQDGMGAVLEGGGLRRWNDGAILSGMDAGALERRYGAPLVAVHRPELQEALLELAGVPVRFGERLVEVDPGGAARFESGTTAEADLVIAADGIRSAARAGLLGDGPPRYSGITALRAVVDWSEPVPPGEYWGARAVFGLVPLPRGRLYWFATRLAPEGEPHDGTVERERLRTDFAGWAAPIPDVIAATDPAAILRHDLHDRPPTADWSRGRAALLGDAAHPMLPFLGQGACQALEDAVALGGAVRAHGPSPDALAAYAAARAPRAAFVVKRSHTFGRTAHAPGAPLRALRNAVMRATPQRARERELDRVLGANRGR